MWFEWTIEQSVSVIRLVGCLIESHRHRKKVLMGRYTHGFRDNMNGDSYSFDGVIKRALSNSRMLITQRVKHSPFPMTSIVLRYDGEDK